MQNTPAATAHNARRRTATVTFSASLDHAILSWCVLGKRRLTAEMSGLASGAEKWRSGTSRWESAGPDDPSEGSGGSADPSGRPMACDPSARRRDA
ncbi:hypothetical protein GCM10022214_05970 [Actinomadura miaoliensis]|uniref:Uncharacterized protein n=1 Tax=Actinomadura miaoliensis TaxID=430685 RepID=A0ABP7V0S0_9ACTN